MTDQSGSGSGDEALTWGVIHDQGQAVFAPAPLVEDLRQLRQAIKAASTWGEFRAQSPPRYLQEISQLLGGEVPDDGEDFDADVIPGFADGDWPEWLHQVMLGWMPGDLAQRFGTVEDSVLNGRMLEIEAGFGEELAKELEARGFTCRRDDNAVSVAAGWA